MHLRIDIDLDELDDASKSVQLWHALEQVLDRVVDDVADPGLIDGLIGWPEFPLRPGGPVRKVGSWELQ